MTQSLSSPTARERETRALADAMRFLNISQGVILTDVNDGPVEADGLTIVIRSIAEWLLEGS
jgi:hypothetical protein